MTRTIAKLFSLFLMLCIVSSYVPVAFAQTETSGVVVGRVHEAGAPERGISGAIVKVKHEETGVERSARTGADGSYRFEILPPGPYTISITAQDYQEVIKSGLNVGLMRVSNVIPPIELQKAASAANPPDNPTANPPGNIQSQGNRGTGQEAFEQLVNTENATRSQNFDRRAIITLPLPGVRTFDDLAFLAPGVAPPPQPIGNSVGPGIGPGVGTSGQFSVNGMRSRSNNFTIDGSDNNDEDVGVRRQGFTSLVPQTIDSLQEFRIITLLPEPQFGRKPGAQVNAVSRSGGTNIRGSLYGFFTNQALRSRDAFDFTGGPATFPVLGNGQQVLLDGAPLVVDNPVGGENRFRQGIYGIALGGPIARPNTLFFVASERQEITARRESHFAVPTVDERGIFGSGATGGVVGPFATSVFGDAFISLFPFPNNPFGPYGGNTYTEVLPASAGGSVFSARLDQQNLKALWREPLACREIQFYR